MEPFEDIDGVELDADPPARLWEPVLRLSKHPDSQYRLEFLPVWLARRYHAQVLSGGHRQYFHNYGASDVAAPPEVLRKLGALGRANLPSVCWSQVRHDPSDPVPALQCFLVVAVQPTFAEEDAAYYAERPNLLTPLESYQEPLPFATVIVDVPVPKPVDGF